MIQPVIHHYSSNVIWPYTSNSEYKNGKGGSGGRVENVNFSSRGKTEAALTAGYEKHLRDKIAKRRAEEAKRAEEARESLPIIIKQTFEACRVSNRDVGTLYKNCTEVANGRQKKDFTEWKDWMLGAFDEIYPQYEDELLPRLIESGYFNQDEQQLSPKNSATKFAYFVLLASNATD